MIVDVIAGARPNFVKVAAVLKGLTAESISFRLIHTGQHYDYQMSESFFHELGIPEPNVNLSCGSGTHAVQTGAIMVAYEKLLTRDPCDICIVVGDVNSTLACSIVAKKKGAKVAHVEAGIRSGDMTMPEEINRIVTDSICDYFFTTSRSAGRNLIESGVSEDRIYFVGNTMIDTLLQNESKFRAPGFWQELALRRHNYYVLTLHRPSNVDHAIALNKKLLDISVAVGDRRIIFPVHPRVRNSIDTNLEENGFSLVDPLPYLEFCYLVKNSMGVITDSGGVTEECTVFGVPCMTMRNSTERPETIEVGSNVLVGEDPKGLSEYIQQINRGAWKNSSVPELWDGCSGERIAKALRSICGLNLQGA